MEGEQSDIEDHNFDDAKEPRGEQEKGKEIHAEGKHYGAHRMTEVFVVFQKNWYVFFYDGLILTSSLIVLQRTNTNGNFTHIMKLEKKK